MPACTSSPTAAGWSAPSRARWPAASTSSSCATRTPPTTSCWPPPRPRASSATPPARSSCSTTAPTSRPPCGADGVHVGQDDMPVDRARKLVGDDAIVGLSTHSMQQAQAGCRSGADYIAVGPVHATPTKEGRPAIGVEPIKYAAAHVVGPVVRHRRHRCRHRRRGGQGGRAADRRRARDRRGRRPRGGGARAARRASNGRRAVGRRSRKRRPAPGPGRGAAAGRARPADRMRRGYARAEERNAAVRARARAARARASARPRSWPPPSSPPLLGIANLVASLAGLDVQGEQPSAIGVLALLRASCSSPRAACGSRATGPCWASRRCSGSSSSSSRSSCCAPPTSLAVVVCVPIICGAGWLFWKLIRVMGRLQAPQRVR